MVIIIISRVINWNELQMREQKKVLRHEHNKGKSSAEVLIMNIGQIQDTSIILPRPLGKMLYKLSN